MELPHVDFLPYPCEACRETFCSKHRTPEAHACPGLETKTLGSSSSMKQEQPLRQPCQLTTCKERVLTLSRCPKCHQSFCLSHRHPEEHQCPNMVSSSLSSSTTVSSFTKPIRTFQPKKSSSKVELMRLKMNAKGDNRIPQESRVYARIIIPSRPQIKELQVYFPQSWPLGKWVDSLASTQRLPGTDQLGEGKRWGLILGDQGFPHRAKRFKAASPGRLVPPEEEEEEEDRVEESPCLKKDALGGVQA
ncbi:MAG: hypothetical protein DHS80DRAFT_29556 [Piptocephalis tieghemiana]|nr:MAG: hypothetical protein DHS80DRAFT_29556 [Piptocephalis tieghemiana]